MDLSLQLHDLFCNHKLFFGVDLLWTLVFFLNLAWTMYFPQERKCIFFQFFQFASEGKRDKGKEFALGNLSLFPKFQAGRS